MTYVIKSLVCRSSEQEGISEEVQGAQEDAEEFKRELNPDECGRKKADQEKMIIQKAEGMCVKLRKLG